MKKIIYCVLIVLFVTSFSAVAQQKQDSNRVELIPLQVGNYWKFVNEHGEIEFARVLETVILKGVTWFKYRELNDDDTFIVRNADKGQFEIDTDTDEVQLVLRFPVDKETQYIQYGVVTNVIPNVEITVPAGTFKTYFYDFSVENPEDQIKVWIAPGIGLIKSVYYEAEYELIEYKIQ